MTHRTTKRAGSLDPNLIIDWRQRASVHDEQAREATKNKLYIIAAQQDGLAAALRICANELESSVVFQQEAELYITRRATELLGKPKRASR